MLVSLVGAGPGESDLWTLRAIARLKSADLVLCDSTVDAGEVRRHTNARVASIDDSQGPSSDGISIVHQMIEAARGGKRVVRLFADDGFVSGCGSVEAAALRAAAIPFEVVPGVSSVIAVPELSGIPVTHRGVASGFVVLSDTSRTSVLRVLRGTQPKALSVVVPGEVSKGQLVGQLLMQIGWNRTTPSAVVYREPNGDQQVWTGSLAQLAGFEAPAAARGVVVVGEVVHVRDLLMESVAGAPNFEVQYGRH